MCDLADCNASVAETVVVTAPEEGPRDINADASTAKENHSSDVAAVARSILKVYLKHDEQR